MKSQSKIWDLEYKRNRNKWHKETTNLPTIIKNKIVLELGVGNGKSLKSILRQSPKELHAIDFSEESINICKSEFNNKNLTFHLANVVSLPFKDTYFDTIVCYYILNNLNNKEIVKVIIEMQRVLKPKGKILFQDFAVGDFRETGKSLGKHTIEKNSGLSCHFFTISELKAVFKDFKSIKLELKTSSPIKSYPELKRKIISGIIS